MRPVPQDSRAILIVLAIAMMPMARAVRADALYQTTDLGAVWSLGLNNSGQVLSPLSSLHDSPVGWSVVVYNSYGPNAGQQITLPLGTGATNDSGIVAGQTIPAKMYATPVNVLVNPNAPTGNQTAFPSNLPSTLGYGLGPGTIAGVNDSNQVVGAANTIAGPGEPAVWIFGNTQIGPTHAYLSSGGIVADLGTLGGPSSAAPAINNAGQVVGTADVSSGVSHAFLYSAGKMIDLGGLPGYSTTTATAINASGEVVGYSGYAGYMTSAFVSRNGKITDLGALPGAMSTLAMGINSQGTIVG